MKKNIISALVVFFTCLLINSCQKAPYTFDAHFYTSRSDSGTFYLYINDDYKGILPYCSVDPLPADSDLAFKTLSFSLDEGKYKIQGRNYYGEVFYSGTLRLHPGDINCKTTMGELKTTNTLNILILKISK